MNKKVSLLIVSLFLTIIVFSISTYLQKKLVDYVPNMKCMVVNKDIEAFELVTEEDIEYIELPISILNSSNLVENFSKIENLYLKDKLYKGQLVLNNQFDSKENLMIYQAEIGKEKIAIKIKTAENGASFTIRENSIVNVYATIPSEYMSELFSNLIIQSIGTKENGYSVVKILDSVKVLGTFNSEGEPLEEVLEKNIDTILIAVTPLEAQKINLLREVATFNLTELGTVIVPSGDSI